MTQPILFVGNYSTDTAPGRISSVALGHAGRLGAELSSVELPNPSFLTVRDITHNRHVLAVLEEEKGALTSLPLSGAQLAEPVWTVPSGGSIPCHLTAHGPNVGVAHYGDGTFALHTVMYDGDAHLSELRLRGEGSGPIHPDQDNPRAHFVLPYAGGYLVSDLGADRLYFYAPLEDSTPGSVTAPASFDAAAEPSPAGFVAPELVLVDEVAFPAGTGPRHLALKDNVLYVSGELDSRLHVVALADPRDEDYAQELFTYIGSEPSVESPGVRSAPSHVAFDESGRFLYFANRFRDTIAVFDTLDIADGLPVLVGEFNCGGHVPRHFAIHESRIYIANQGSDSIDVFDLLPHTGFLGPKVQSVSWQRPSCLVFAEL